MRRDCRPLSGAGRAREGRAEARRWRLLVLLLVNQFVAEPYLAAGQSLEASAAGRAASSLAAQLSRAQAGAAAPGQAPRAAQQQTLQAAALVYSAARSAHHSQAGAPPAERSAAAAAVGANAASWHVLAAHDSGSTSRTRGRSLQQLSANSTGVVARVRAPALSTPRAAIAYEREPFEVVVESQEKGCETNNPAPILLVNFGRELTQQDPLQLVNVSGTNRTDVIFEVDSGQLFLVLHVPDERNKAVLVVDVAAGITADLQGNPNQAARRMLVYVPGKGKAAARAAQKAWAATFVATMAAASVGSMMAPESPGGFVGHTASGMLNWAQSFYFTTQIAVPALPAFYRQAGDSFKFAVADLAFPALDRALTSVRSDAVPSASYQGFATQALTLAADAPRVPTGSIVDQQCAGPGRAPPECI